MSVKVFMISRDASALNPKSDTTARLRLYGERGAEITVAYFTPARAAAVICRGLWTVRRGWVVTSQDPFEAGFIAWAIARLCGAALELQLHGDFFGPYWYREAWHRPLRLILARWLLRHADGVRVPSNRVARSLASFVGSSRIALIPVPPRVIAVGPRHQTRKAIAYSGRFSKEKNLDLLLDAFSKVRECLPDALLILEGEGSEGANLSARASKVNDKFGEDTVQFAKWHTGGPWTTIRDAHVCAISSNHESWNRFAVEAALSGCPIVMTDVGCAGEVIKDGESGWVVPVGDENAFARALREAIENPDEARRRAENARRAAEQLPNAYEISSRIVAAWERLSSKRVVA